MTFPKLLHFARHSAVYEDKLWGVGGVGGHVCPSSAKPRKDMSAQRKIEHLTARNPLLPSTSTLCHIVRGVGRCLKEGQAARTEPFLRVVFPSGTLCDWMK